MGAAMIGARRREAVGGVLDSRSGSRRALVFRARTSRFRSPRSVRRCSCARAPSPLGPRWTVGARSTPRSARLRCETWGASGPRWRRRCSFWILGPSRPPLADLLGRPPGRRSLRPKPSGPTAPRRHQDVGVEIALIALLAGPVHGDVGDHAARDDVLRDEVPHQLPALLEIEFMGQGQQQFARRNGVLAAFALLGRVPQRLAVAEGRRRARPAPGSPRTRCPPWPRNRTPSPGARRSGACAGPIGRGGDGRAAGAALDGLNAANDTEATLLLSPDRPGGRDR